jgi:DNA-binding response OmpR family regulator
MPRNQHASRTDHRRRRRHRPEIVAELTSHGLEVDWADNGREGLAKAIAGGYDLITLDRMLPEVDGLTIVTTLRNLGSPRRS